MSLVPDEKCAFTAAERSQRQNSISAQQEDQRLMALRCFLRQYQGLRVQITVVDVYGQRHVCRALTGHTLSDVLQEHTELLGDEEVTESPEGRGVLECVVSVPNEYLSQIPQTKDYLEQLRQITPSVTSNCRLGSKIILTKEMNDMQVALHEVYPWRTV